MRRGKRQTLTAAQKKLPTYLLRTIYDDAVRYVCEHKDEYIVDPARNFTRDRKLTFEETIRFMVSMYSGTLNRELINYFGATDSPCKAAFIRRRRLIRPDAFRTLFDVFNAGSRQWDKRRFRGYRLYAIDGSGIRVTKNPDSPTFHANTITGGENLLHLNALYDIMNKTYESYTVQACQEHDERLAGQEMLRKLDPSEKSIVLFDAGYTGYYQIEFLNRLQNLDYVIRTKRGAFKFLSLLPDEEHDRQFAVEVRNTQRKCDKDLYAKGQAVYIPGPSRFGKEKKSTTWYFEAPCTVKFRVVKFQIDTGEWETLITSLSKEEFPIETMKDLYHRRWGIETSFRDLKLNLGIEKLHTKDETLVLQEIAARMVLFNLCMRMILNSTPKCWRGPKWMSQPGFTDSIYLCREWMLDNEPPPDEAMFRRYKEPVRPGRRDPRNLRLKTFPYFTYRTAA